MPGTSPAKKGPGGNGLHVASSSSVELLLAAREAELVAAVVDRELEDEEVVELDDEELLEVAGPPGKAPAKRALSISMLH